MQHLPNPRFSRLVTLTAFDLTDPSLDSMILAWDHIATRFLNRIRHHREAAGRIESIRLLAIHDAVHAVFGSGGGFIYKRSSADDSLAAALAATARASHDVLSSVFETPSDLTALAHSLEESLGLIAGEEGSKAGESVGAQSASSYLGAFGPSISEAREVVMAASGSGALRFIRQPLVENRFPNASANRPEGIRWRRSA